MNGPFQEVSGFIEPDIDLECGQTVEKGEIPPENFYIQEKGRSSCYCYASEKNYPVCDRFTKPRNISERLSSDRRQTNNTAEILAATLAIQKVWLNGEYTLEIRSDSEVLVKGITDWIHQWERNGWKTALGAPVINKREYCELRDAMSQMNKVDFVHVRREHNKQADALARDGANFRV
ncbi:unnamed protein product [Allacma fusca]|uniref:ribonuclease H n=1 Tax=Allacma fusca TaxID=39272 RepID=A0A8J2LHV8_9HEXA|nr:unnamed protein product [Allacma fusca]